MPFGLAPEAVASAVSDLKPSEPANPPSIFGDAEIDEMTLNEASVHGRRRRRFKNREEGRRGERETEHLGEVLGGS